MPDVGGIAGERLRSFIERIERLEEEKRALSDDIKEVFAEAKGSGFDTAIMRQIIRIRRMDKDDVDEQETLLDVYKRALGMLPDYRTRGRGGGVAARVLGASGGLAPLPGCLRERGLSLHLGDRGAAVTPERRNCPASVHHRGGNLEQVSLFARRSACLKGIPDARCCTFARRLADARLCPCRCSFPDPGRDSRVERLYAARPDRDKAWCYGQIIGQTLGPEDTQKPPRLSRPRPTATPCSKA